MIEATVAIVAMAALFVLFGTLRLADRRGCDGGCAGCAHDCDNHQACDRRLEGGVR